MVAATLEGNEDESIVSTKVSLSSTKLSLIIWTSNCILVLPAGNITGYVPDPKSRPKEHQLLSVTTTINLYIYVCV